MTVEVLGAAGGGVYAVVRGHLSQDEVAHLWDESDRGEVVQQWARMKAGTLTLYERPCWGRFRVTVLYTYGV